jgi:hypothetical protein
MNKCKFRSGDAQGDSQPAFETHDPGLKVDERIKDEQSTTQPALYIPPMVWRYVCMKVCMYEGMYVIICILRTYILMYLRHGTSFWQRRRPTLTRSALVWISQALITSRWLHLWWLGKATLQQLLVRCTARTAARRQGSDAWPTQSNGGDVQTDRLVGTCQASDSDSHEEPATGRSVTNSSCQDDDG